MHVAHLAASRRSSFRGPRAGLAPPPGGPFCDAVTPSPRRQRLLLVAQLALFAVALVALRRELALVHPAQLRHAFAEYGWGHLGVALACTAGSFLVLGAIEILGLRYADTSAARRVPARTAVVTSFVAHAISQSTGWSLLTGAALRLRAYATYGVGAASVAVTSAFVSATVWLGLLAAGAAALLASGEPVRVGAYELAARPIGAALAVVVAAYIAWAVLGRRPAIGLGRWAVRRPSGATAGGQVALSVLDWLLTGSVLYAFLPPALALRYAPFLRVYLVALTLAVISHVPGGVGVFEAALLGLLRGATGGRAASLAAAVAASLVMYRVVYYLLPLAAALLASAAGVGRAPAAAGAAPGGR